MRTAYSTEVKSVSKWKAGPKSSPEIIGEFRDLYEDPGPLTSRNVRTFWTIWPRVSRTKAIGTEAIRHQYGYCSNLDSMHVERRLAGDTAATKDPTKAGEKSS